jgi:hypothetical protein
MPEFSCIFGILPDYITFILISETKNGGLDEYKIRGLKALGIRH